MSPVTSAIWCHCSKTLSSDKVKTFILCHKNQILLVYYKYTLWEGKNPQQKVRDEAGQTPSSKAPNNGCPSGGSLTSQGSCKRQAKPECGSRLAERIVSMVLDQLTARTGSYFLTVFRSETMQWDIRKRCYLQEEPALTLDSSSCTMGNKFVI